jgi:hypothetical protein
MLKGAFDCCQNVRACGSNTDPRVNEKKYSINKVRKVKKKVGISALGVRLE